jgi:hypothetical protein
MTDDRTTTDKYSTHRETKAVVQELFASPDDVSVSDIKDFDWTHYDVTQAESESDDPHHEVDILAYLYWIEDCTQEEIGDRYGYSISCISRHMTECGIPTGADPTKHTVSIGVYENGHSHWKCIVKSNDKFDSVNLHRLLAVAEYGYEEVVDKEVHHETGCSLDNRPDAITLMDKGEHLSLHKSNDTEFVIENGEPRLRNGDADPEALSAVDEWWTTGVDDAV